MLTKVDLVNIHNLLQRARFNGLEEAEVAVVLSQKIKVMLNGGNVPNPTQPSPTSSQ